MAKTTCRDCNRTVVMVRVGGDLVATDPELITVVAARERSPAGRDMPGIVMASRQTWARRVHAERCTEYREQARRERIAQEMREFSARNGNQSKERAPRAARKNCGL